MSGRRLVTDREWPGYILALFVTGVVTGSIAVIRQTVDVSNISMLYLPAVLVVAVLFGSRPAILASAAAFLGFNFFLIEPRYTFAVADEEEWITLVLLLASGVVTGQLAAALRTRAREAARREREAVVLYDVVHLMAVPDLQEALTGVAERLRAELDLHAVAIVLPETTRDAVTAEAGDDVALARIRSARPLPEGLLSEGRAPVAAKRGSTGRWIRVVSPSRPAGGDAGRQSKVQRVPVRVRGEPVGSLFLVGDRDSRFGAADNRLLSAVASQVGAGGERARLREEATESEILRRTDSLRAALLNAVSHDLRTPLSSIIAFAESLLEEGVRWGALDRREFAQAIVREAERLNRIVGNLLDLSRIEAGAIRPERTWRDLGSLIDDVVRRLGGVTQEHKMAINVPEGLPPLVFDYVEIDQVISNLIENAAKYTGPQAEIIISARVVGGEVQVEVADRGPGISTEAMPHLFDAFYRAPSGGQGAPGNGLGLAVAKGLVEAHGGRIWAESQPSGGARFVFTLPLDAASLAPQPEPAA